MKFLAPGDAAPDFEALAIGGPYGAKGTTVRLRDFRGVAVVSLFLPKDETPGCTKQACEMRDRWSRLQRPDTAFLA